MTVNTAFAFEVMDKEWPLWLVLAGFLGLGVIGMLVSRKWPVFSILALLLIGFGGIRQIGELSDTHVGPAIRAEAGLSYVILSYFVVVCGIVLVVLGTIQGWKRRKPTAGPQ